MPVCVQPSVKEMQVEAESEKEKIRPRTGIEEKPLNSVSELMINK